MSVNSPQKRATIVATATAIALTVIKLVIGATSGSVAVLASAIDSLLDMVISLFNFFAIKKSEENPNSEYQYGKGKIQAIAGVIEGTIITVSGLFIIYKGVENLIKGESVSFVGSSIAAMLISISITFMLVKYLLSVAKDTNNIVIKADALHYQTDLWSNAIVLLSLILVWITDIGAIDALFGIGIGIYIIYAAYGVIKEGISILLDRALDGETVNKIMKIIDGHSKTTSHHWLKTRTDGSTNFVEFHLVLRPDMLLSEAHEISDQIEEQIIKLDNKKRWLIVPHYDPYDDEDINMAIFNGNKKYKEIYLLSPSYKDNTTHLPVISFSTITEKIEFLDCDTLMFTSKQAVKCVDSIDKKWREYPSIAIGYATQKQIKDLGGRVIYCSKNFYADEMAEDIANSLQNKKILYLRPKEVSFDAKSYLASRGIILREQIIYETSCVKYMPKYAPKENAIIIFTSPSTIHCFLKNFSWHPSYVAIIIGRATLKHLPKNADYAVADMPTISSCIAKAKEIVYAG